MNNVRHAIIGQLKNPSPGFEDAVRMHFYLKKERILKVYDFVVIFHSVCIYTVLVLLYCCLYVYLVLLYSLDSGMKQVLSDWLRLFCMNWALCCTKPDKYVKPDH